MSAEIRVGNTTNGTLIKELLEEASINNLPLLCINPETGEVLTNNIIQYLIRTIPAVNQTFTGEFNLSDKYQTYYNQYVLDTELIPTVKANPLIGAFARIVINASPSAILNVSNLGEKRVGSDTFTVGKLNELVLVMEEEGLYYRITILN